MIGDQREGKLTMTNAIQVWEVCASESEARIVYLAMSEQVGFLGGRVLEPSASKPGWKSQTFHDASGIDRNSWLPDGCRYVMVPKGMLR